MVFRTISRLFFKWLNDTRGTFLHTKYIENRYIIYARNEFKPLLVMKKEVNDKSLITFNLVGGSIIKTF